MFLTYTLRVVIFQSEMQLMKGIVPQKHERTVFDTIIQQALDAVVSEGEVFFYDDIQHCMMCLRERSFL